MMRPVKPNSLARPPILRLVHLISVLSSAIRSAKAAPFHVSAHTINTATDGKAAQDPSLWMYLGFAAVLVLLGGAFAGLTIALMGQDEIYLQVIATSGDRHERKNATKVLRLLQRGKHWVLVTLLLSNVITNETLPIVLDRSLGGGWPAVLGSTVLIVIFGEVAPQSVCVRYGLPIGAWMAPFVLGLMYLLAPVAWPTAKLLDWLLGEDHGTVYKKAGLKTLVSLHKGLGEAGQQLNSDEVTIISAVLDLKDKSVGSIMTPMDDVFTLSLDDVLDEETMDVLLSQGYSRIPIHHPDNSENFVGMLLVKMLITYDPEDAKPVRDFALATLPETAPNTSCLDIVNFFQEGKSHMVLVSAHPGDDHGALGVVTLEDVIEELIGEEIIDESDVFIDVHKAIKRMTPAPRTRIARPPTNILLSPKMNGTSGDLIDITEGEQLSGADLLREESKTAQLAEPQVAKPKPTAMISRRRSSATGSVGGDLVPAVKRPSTDEIREHLKHLGPSNLASRPKATRYASVKIKPGSTDMSRLRSANAMMTPVRRISEDASAFQTGIGEGVLASGGKEASDAVHAVQQNYGGSPTERRPPSAQKGTQSPEDLLRRSNDSNEALDRRPRSRQKENNNDRDRSRSTVRSLPDITYTKSSYNFPSDGPARSGSITENIIDAHGIRKVVLETTSSSSSNEEEENSGANKGSRKANNGQSEASSRSQKSGSGLRGGGGLDGANDDEEGLVKKKKRRKKRSSQRKSEDEPLLG